MVSTTLGDHIFIVVFTLIEVLNSADDTGDQVQKSQKKLSSVAQLKTSKPKAQQREHVAANLTKVCVGGGGGLFEMNMTLERKEVR